MMPLTLADIGEKNIIKHIGGSPEVKKHLENSRRYFLVLHGCGCGNAGEVVHCRRSQGLEVVARCSDILLCSVRESDFKAAQAARRAAVALCVSYRFGNFVVIGNRYFPVSQALDSVLGQLPCCAARAVSVGQCYFYLISRKVESCIRRSYADIRRIRNQVSPGFGGLRRVVCRAYEVKNLG